MNEMQLWDYISIGATLLVVVAYIVLRMKKALNPNSGGCSCSCSDEIKEKCGKSAYVPLSELSDNHPKQL